MIEFGRCCPCLERRAPSPHASAMKMQLWAYANDTTHETASCMSKGWQRHLLYDRPSDMCRALCRRGSVIPTDARWTHAFPQTYLGGAEPSSGFCKPIFLLAKLARSKSRISQITPPLTLFMTFSITFEPNSSIDPRSCFPCNFSYGVLPSFPC